LLLVIGFAVRAGHLEFDSALLRGLAKFVVTGLVLAAVLWFAARFAAVQFAHLAALRDEATLALLIVVGAVVYVASILLLFGGGWIRSLVRG
jgi:putative peptidoglycan lipid II flippase